MAGPDTDANLLFGVLAFQLDLIDARQFVEACTLWAARKEVPLADVLVDCGWLDAEARREVERVLQRKLRRHGDAGRGLERLAATHVGSLLSAVADFEVRSRLSVLSGGPPRPGSDVPTLDV